MFCEYSDLSEVQKPDMHPDQILVGSILSSIQDDGSPGELYGLYKEMKPGVDERSELGVILAAARKTHPIGMYVCVKDTTHIGIIESYNERLGGFYPGVRYPINIRVLYSTLSKAVGCVFEYAADQLIDVDENELAYYDVLNKVSPRMQSAKYMLSYTEWSNL